MEFRAASRLPQAPAREGRKPVVCRTHNIWEPLPRLPENPGKPRTRGSGVLSLSAYATIWHRPLVPAHKKLHCLEECKPKSIKNTADAAHPVPREQTSP